MIQLDDKKRLVISSFGLLLIQIVMLSQFAYVNSHFPSGIEDGFLNSIRFIIAGQVFMMLSFIVQIGSYFFIHKFSIIGMVGMLFLGFVLTFIGMCIGIKYYDGTYDSAAANWWQEGGLVLLGLLNCQTIYQWYLSTSGDQPLYHEQQ